MAQDYGAAQPLIDLGRRAYSTVRKYVGDDATPRSASVRVDPAYQRDMLARANAGFRQQAETAAKTPVPNTVKRTLKRAPARPAAKRR
jgi:hypothetical protein